MQKEENPSGFPRTKLPWIAGVIAFIVFLITLNQWVNLRSLAATAKVTGWDWSLPLQSPLFHVVTFPFRWLPEAVIPVALNAFSAVCAALVIVLLARSVALLPHDRTHEQRLRERSEFSLLSIKFAWVPVIFAALVCALQLTFWEHATSVTGEMLDLLLFAYVIRCLLEFRISQKDSWLVKFAFVYGLGVTNNWALIGFFPFFLAAVIWIKGIRFFEAKFLVRMLVAGIAGLLLYLLLPIVWAIKAPSADYGFWDILKSNWQSQKLFLVDTKMLRNRAMLLALPSVLPVILMGIRWPSSFGDTSAAGSTLTNLAFRVIHLFFLAAWLTIVFDPKYSPRSLGYGLPFLTFYYLGALAVGYYSGYALLVFRELPKKSNWVKELAIFKVLNPVVQAVVLIAAVAIPVALVVKNYKLVHANNGRILKEFAAQTARLLPKGAAYLLSEDPVQLMLLRGYLAPSDADQQYVLVNVKALELPMYHAELRKTYGEKWPELGNEKELGSKVEQPIIQELLARIAASNTVVYLHASFGYFFERMYPTPAGSVSKLTLYKPEQVLPPALTPEVISLNQDLWKETLPFVDQLQSVRKLDIPDGNYVITNYSKALNAWGVALQRNGKVDEARDYFNRALSLNSNNLSAQINLDFNDTLKTGKVSEEKLKLFEEQFRSWNSMLVHGGPVDHPEFCVALGDIFVNQFQYRQAAQEYSRVAEVRPREIRARIGLAKAYVYGGWLDKALGEINSIPKDFPEMAVIHKLELASLEAAALFNKGELDAAEQRLQKARADFPNFNAPTQSLLELYRVSGKYTNALNLVDEQIKRSSPTNYLPQMQKAELLINIEQFERAHEVLAKLLVNNPKLTEAMLLNTFAYIQEGKLDQALKTVTQILEKNSDNVQARVYKAIVLMEQKKYEQAQEEFAEILEEQPGNIVALRNRAILNLRMDKLSAARRDYELLQRVLPRSHAIYYGLAEVAYKSGDLKTAAANYQSYLKYAPQQGGKELAEEKARVLARLDEINKKK